MSWWPEQVLDAVQRDLGGRQDGGDGLGGQGAQPVEHETAVERGAAGVPPRVADVVAALSAVEHPTTRSRRGEVVTERVNRLHRSTKFLKNLGARVRTARCSPELLDVGRSRH